MGPDAPPDVAVLVPELAAGDVRQWVYCPRIVYFRFCQPLQRPVRRAFVHFLPGERVEEVPITANGRAFVRRVLRDIRACVAAERMPDPTPRRGRCVDCEYRLYCGDVEVSECSS